MKLFCLLTLTACVAANSLLAAPKPIAQNGAAPSAPAAAAAPVATVTDKGSGATFPAEVNFEQNGKKYHLALTGTATRKKFFVKVYGVASYLQDGGAPVSGDKYAEFTNDNKAKQLTIKWVHAAPADKVKDQYIESFKTNLSPEDFNRLQPEINTWLSFFNRDIKNGDEQMIRWTPGGYIEFTVNNQKIGSINNEAFAKGLWSLWFGPNTSFDKAALVSQMK